MDINWNNLTHSKRYWRIVFHTISAYKTDKFWSDRIAVTLSKRPVLYFNVSPSHTVVQQIRQQFGLARRLDILHEILCAVAQPVEPTSEIIPQIKPSAHSFIPCTIQSRHEASLCAS
jgi:hypothetical protein